MLNVVSVLNDPGWHLKPRISHTKPVLITAQNSKLHHNNINPYDMSQTWGHFSYNRGPKLKQMRLSLWSCYKWQLSGVKLYLSKPIHSTQWWPNRVCVQSPLFIDVSEATYAYIIHVKKSNAYIFDMSSDSWWNNIYLFVRRLIHGMGWLKILK